jgi:hypothetical protein
LSGTLIFHLETIPSVPILPACHFARRDLVY